MSNMSYCRFESTSRDLADCVSAMEEAYDMDELDLNQYELYKATRAVYEIDKLWRKLNAEANKEDSE